MLSTIEEWDITATCDNWYNFLSVMKAIEEKEQLTEEESNILHHCPLSKPADYEIVPEKGKFKIKLKRNDFDLFYDETWIPFLARFLEGVMTVKSGIEGNWRIKFYGDGIFRYYEAVVEYQEKEFKKPKHCKLIIDRIVNQWQK
jgi:hypothetical protein